MAASVALLLVIALHLVSVQGRQPSRLAPPPTVDCPRNQLTAYTGRVTRWSRTVDQSTLTIATDWDTTETVTVEHPKTDDPSEFFLLDAERFQPGDWAQIEEKRGTLKAGMRATAWACDDGRQPMIDWQPPQK